MTVSYHPIYWGAYLCLALITLLIFFVAIFLSKALGRSCDPLRKYVPIPMAPRPGSTHEEIALQEKPPPLPPNDEKV